MRQTFFAIWSFTYPAAHLHGHAEGSTTVILAAQLSACAQAIKHVSFSLHQRIWINYAPVFHSIEKPKTCQIMQASRPMLKLKLQHALQEQKSLTCCDKRPCSVCFHAFIRPCVLH